MASGECIDNVMNNENRALIKSKHRVRKHGEVFTPQWVIDKMIAIPGIKEKAEDIFATFLEPSAGEGAFLLAILDIKLKFVTENHNKTWDRYALWALCSIYGIEFLEDNLAIARQNMLELFLDYYEDVYNTALSEQSDLYKSARTIIWANIVQGDTLTRKNIQGKEIMFSHWDRVPKEPSLVQRIPFTYSSLFKKNNCEIGGTQLRLFEADKPTGSQLSLFADEYDNAPSQSYTIVDIKLVWREEKINVEEI